MTKAEIIAELLRSAAEDRNPLGAVSALAWDKLLQWKQVERDEYYDKLSNKEIRMFYLLVACALESE